MKRKVYNNAPLPFMGQKRRFIKTIKDVIKSHPDDTVYVDLFGGSGLLSHTVKDAKPDSTVIYNDFDNYRERLANIQATNVLLNELRPLFANVLKNGKVSLEAKEKGLSIVKHAEVKNGYVDYITLSSSLLFSMNYALSLKELAKEPWYNNIKQSDYDAIGYLKGVIIEIADYKQLFEKYRHNANVIWLVDPPYLSTETKTYKSDSYWKIRDYLDVLDVLEGSNYVYFTSNKSQIVELCDWIETRTSIGNPFFGATTTTVDVTMNHNSKYTDVMLYKYDLVAAKK